MWYINLDGVINPTKLSTLLCRGNIFKQTFLRGIMDRTPEFFINMWELWPHLIRNNLLSVCTMGSYFFIIEEFLELIIGTSDFIDFISYKKVNFFIIFLLAFFFLIQYAELIEIGLSLSIRIILNYHLGIKHFIV